MRIRTHVAFALVAVALIASQSQAAPAAVNARYCAANQAAAEAGARAKANRSDAGWTLTVTGGAASGCLGLYFLFGGLDFGAAGTVCSIVGGIAGLASASSASAQAAETSRAEYLRLRDRRCVKAQRVG